MQSNSFEYKALNDEKIVIQYDHNAVTTGGGGKTDEPAWSFRLWNGSIYLSRYLETIAACLRDEVVIDLGCGTGLTSIVLGKCCGVKKVYATDLNHAIPLLSHNISLNIQPLLPPKPPPSLQECTPICPASHDLTQVTAECEGYMCNVCDDDIDEDSCIHRCVECNFDICYKCIAKMKDGELDSFPDWFRLHVQSRQSQPSKTQLSGAGDSDATATITPFVYDWSDESSLRELVDVVTTAAHGKDGRRVKYLIGADVTYSMKSIDLFFTAVTDLTTALHLAYASRPSSSDDTTILLFTHHNRSDDTNAHMLQQLQLRFEGKYVEVSFDALAEDDREDVNEAEITGEMKIYRVTL